MGNYLSEILKSVFDMKKESRLLLLGLDNAGKTAILYRIKLGKFITTIPSIGFNVETVEYKNFSFIMWDIPFRPLTRQQWRHYSEGTQGLIFIVDSNDRARLEEARDELRATLEGEELRGAILLILANKQDLPNAMKPTELTEGLALHKFSSTRKWHLQLTSAVTGEGIFEGLDWLEREINVAK